VTVPLGTGHRHQLAAEGRRLLEFAVASRHPEGGFAWLDDRGHPDLTRPVELWITCRMTHVFSLASLLGHPGAEELADHGVASLTGRLRDHRHGGWYAAVDHGGPTTRDKGAYEHAFVLLAAASAAVAGRPTADGLLDEALAIHHRRFWDDDAGAVVESWNEDFTVVDGYRGLNANMHTVEALLAAGDATGDPALHARAHRITQRVMRVGPSHGWRLPEHYDATWSPLLEYNRERPADPFRPYGATVGHALEWARLLLHVRATVDPNSAELLTAATSLFDRAVADGWAADGRPGFVYTTDWAGQPIVRQRLHWVVTEAIASAAALHLATGDDRYAEHYRRWWRYAEDHLIDHEHGGWRHELAPDNQPAATVWSGKPDTYHAFQATLLPLLPLAPGLARSLQLGENPHPDATNVLNDPRGPGTP
jgi:sulfoquinovose isomerase